MIKVAMCQTDTVGTPQENVALIGRMVKEAAENGADVAVFPEDCYFDVDAPRIHGECPEALDGYFVTKMCGFARENHINLIPGSFERLAPSGKYYNTALFINRDGEIIGSYDKIHLMRAMSYDEGEHVEAGSSPAVFDTDIGRIGMMVCYDLRFPELARGMVQDGADIIFVPAFWPAGAPLPPRTDHWDTLVNCTALLNQTYEAEQKQLEAEASTLQQEIEVQERQNENLEKFIQKAHKYVGIEELDGYALRELVPAIYVDAPDKSSGKRVQHIHIKYDGLGFISLNELVKKETA